MTHSYVRHDLFSSFYWIVTFSGFGCCGRYGLGRRYVQGVAVYCSLLQCVAVCCSVLQGVAVCCRVLQCVAVCCSVLHCVALCCTVWQCVAVCSGVGVAVFQQLRVLWSGQAVRAVCCSVLQCVAVAARPYQLFIFPYRYTDFSNLLQLILIQQLILLIVQYKYLKSCSGDFILQNLILRTRLCGTGFIT